MDATRATSLGCGCVHFDEYTDGLQKSSACGMGLLLAVVLDGELGNLALGTVLSRLQP